MPIVELMIRRTIEENKKPKPEEKDVQKIIQETGVGLYDSIKPRKEKIIDCPP